MFENVILSNRFVVYVLSQPLCCFTNASGVIRVTIGIGQKRVWPFNDLHFFLFERPLVAGGPKYLVVSKSTAFNVNVSPVIMFTFCNIKIVWLHQIVRFGLGIYFSLAVFGAIGNSFGITNLRSYRFKSEFYNVFKQDKCTRLNFKRIFICL